MKKGKRDEDKEGGQKRKYMCSGVSQIWAQISALPPLSHLTLGETVTHPVCTPISSPIKRLVTASPTQSAVEGSQHRPPAIIIGPSTGRPQGRLTLVASVLFTFFTAF